MNLPNSGLQTRIYGVDGSLSVFTQADPAQVQRIIQDVQRLDFFRQDRITIAARHSVTTRGRLSSSGALVRRRSGPWCAK